VLNAVSQIFAAVGAVTSVLTTLVAQLPGLDRPAGRKPDANDRVGAAWGDSDVGKYEGRGRRGAGRSTAESPVKGSWVGAGRTASSDRGGPGESVSVYSADRRSVAQHGPNGAPTVGSSRPRASRQRGLRQMPPTAVSGSRELPALGQEIAWLGGRSRSDDTGAAAPAATSTVLGNGHRHVRLLGRKR
jgi:hypothetical protein